MSGRSISPYEQFGTASPATDATLEEHLFVRGETLSGIAQQKLGDWQLWRLIADRNDIVDARRIEPGTMLLIPERPLETGRFESR